MPRNPVPFNSFYFNPITASPIVPSFKDDQQSAKVVIRKTFSFPSSSRLHVKECISKCTVMKVELLQGGNILCLHACVCVGGSGRGRWGQFSAQKFRGLVSDRIKEAIRFLNT